jgi:hypothetical protein
MFDLRGEYIFTSNSHFLTEVDKDCHKTPPRDAVQQL